MGKALLNGEGPLLPPVKDQVIVPYQRIMQSIPRDFIQWDEVLTPSHRTQPGTMSMPLRMWTFHQLHPGPYNIQKNHNGGATTSP
jgi:hypothetical protein